MTIVFFSYRKTRVSVSCRPQRYKKCNLIVIYIYWKKITDLILLYIISATSAWDGFLSFSFVLSHKSFTEEKWWDESLGNRRLSYSCLLLLRFRYHRPVFWFLVYFGFDFRLWVAVAPSVPTSPAFDSGRMVTPIASFLAG